jgi:hypothetical protein
LNYAREIKSLTKTGLPASGHLADKIRPVDHDLIPIFRCRSSVALDGPGDLLGERLQNF